MTGATAKSTPKASKIDEKELARLQKQDYWLQMSRAKLVMDLIFVCTLKAQRLDNLLMIHKPMIYSTSSGQENQ
jgi:sulfite reductase alpha subunit-like flavoprotein